MNKVKELETKIEDNKEILSTFPQNNKKNICIYMDKIKTLKDEFQQYDKVIIKEISKRYEIFKRVKENKNKLKIREEILNLEGILYLLNDVETSFEKMDLDKAIQNLSYYYKKNLEVVNDSILFILKKFKEVGITLKEEDFCYSNYVRDYLKIFFGEFLTDENVNSNRIKAKFEEIYWKCPDIITHIELNIRYLYLKNEKQIDKYYENQKNALLKKFTSDNLIERYIELKRELLENEEDKYTIVNGLINGELNVKDFSESSIENYYIQFVEKDIIKDASKEKLDEIDMNLMKLLNSVYEYDKYLKFKFVFDDIKEIYKEKDKYKNSYNDTRKEINKKEQKVLALNKKINGKGLFKKPSEESITEQNNLILEIKKLYKELDKFKVYNKIFDNINNNSTLKDLIYVASSFYKYLSDCIIKNNKNIKEEDIEKKILEIQEFMKWPYYTIINNVDISEDKDLLLIIKDRYQLLGINITKEDLNSNNLNNLMNNINKLKTNHNIRKNKIDIKEVENMIKFKKILEQQ